MKIIYIKETEESCDFIKRIIININKFLNIIRKEYVNDNTVYCLPVFKVTKMSRFRIKKITNRINKLLEKDGTNIVVLSQNLICNQLLKNYLCAKNINILDGRYLFKCLTHKILEYIFEIKNKAMEFRRSFIVN